MTLQAPAPIRSIDKGLDSQVDTPRQATVRTAAEWDALWRLHGGERTRPAVDFGKEMVVAVFLGSRPTAGFSVEIVGTRDDGPALVVQYRETRPPAGRHRRAGPDDAVPHRGRAEARGRDGCEVRKDQLSQGTVSSITYFSLCTLLLLGGGGLRGDRRAC